MVETTTETVDRNGRLTIDKKVRELLGIDGEKATVRLDIEVREVKDD
jgi:bifunctional DNA-binding transcriptional regulator/antitoxin component of YhaV-PrlF toxin-antitoxin module